MPDAKSKPVEEQPAEKQEQLAAQANEQVKSRIQQETEQGFRGGAEVDQTPNENYTVAGVTAGLPVPEADSNPPEARRKAAAPVEQ